MMLKAVLLILYMFCVGLGFAQEPIEPVEPVETDTIEEPSPAVKWFTESQLANPAIAEPNFVDTTLNEFQRYEFAYRKSPFFSYKGFVGHANRNLKFTPLSSEHGFSYLRDDIYKGNLFSHDDIKFYRPEYVFTDLYYVTGGEPEQLFYALHSQRLSERLVTSFKYQVTRAPGIYSSIKANNTNFYGSVDYHSEDERYQLLGSFVWNRMRNQESGGLSNPAGFEEDEARDSVLLYNAEGRYRETQFNLHQYYQLGFYRNGDSDIDNENVENNDRRFVNLGRISHKASYNRHSYIFDENDRPYNFFEGYPNADSLQTYDSTTVHNVSNRISYSNYRLEQERVDFPLFFNVYLEHNFFSINHPFDLKKEFDQFTQGMQLNTDPEQRFTFDGFYNYTIGGYNDGDLSAGISGKFNDIGKNNNRLEMRLSYRESEAPYIMNDYFSNYVFWDNHFDKTKIANAGVIFGNPDFSIDLNIFHLDNWQYFNHEALPQQADEDFFVTSAGLESVLSFGVIRFDNKIVYQYLSDNNYERFPQLASYNSLYADLVLFDKALYAQVGLDARYNSPYHPQDYMPVHKQFYIQESYETPHQVFLDAFVNAKIGKARLFLKWENLGSLLWDQPPIYKIPFYPLPPAEIRFGVSWMFFD